MDDLLGFKFDHPVYHWLAAGAVALVARLFISFTEAMQQDKFFRAFFLVLWGFGDQKNQESTIPKDYLLGFVLGAMESAAYPVLFAVGKPEYVGAWLAFKTVNKWKYKKMERGLFNRYLVANGIILIGSYFLARCFFPLAAS